MPFRLRASTEVLVLAFAVSTTPAVAAPWFVGAFQSPADTTAESQMAVVCRAGERCTVTVARAGSQPRPVEIPIQAPPKLLDPEIPNNNLDGTRKAAADNPDWYKHPSFGPVLAPLRAALQSGARFSECADLDGTGYLALCSLSSDRAATEGAMLLISTMNGSCGSLPFCAYYFVPLDRVAGR